MLHNYFKEQASTISTYSVTIAAIHKERWEIELFFKAIKQNLKIKRFYGTLRNAYLLFCILKFTTKSARTFACFISVFPTVAFQRRSLFDWFSDSPPIQTHNVNSVPRQPVDKTLLRLYSTSIHAHRAKQQEKDSQLTACARLPPELVLVLV